LCVQETALTRLMDRAEPNAEEDEQGQGGEPSSSSSSASNADAGRRASRAGSQGSAQASGSGGRGSARPIRPTPKASAKQQAGYPPGVYPPAVPVAGQHGLWGVPASAPHPGPGLHAHAAWGTMPAIPPRAYVPDQYMHGYASAYAPYEPQAAYFDEVAGDADAWANSQADV
jgi:hypothetical protein